MEKNMISINKKVTEKVKTIEVNGDIIVPDIKPDIVNIIATNGNAYIYKEEISKSRVRIDGNIDTYVIYLSESGETRSIQTTLNFIESIDDDSVLDTMFVKEHIVLKSIETKILNERKISIKANLEVRCELFEKSEIEIFNKFDELKNVEKLQESIKIKSIIGMNKVKNSIKEDIGIDTAYEVAEILKTDISLSNYENKISYNKVLAKVDVNIKIMFLAEDGRIGIAQGTFPVMSFIDIDKVTDENICNVEYVIRNMLFKTNSKEMHSISCQVDFEVSCEAYESTEISIIQDMYGIKNDIQFSKKEVEVQVDKELFAQRIKVDEKILVEDIISIYDVDCKTRILNKTKTGSFINYEGEVELDIYFDADNGTGLNVKNAKVSFLAKTDVECENIDIKIISKNFEVSNEYVNCDIELEMKQTNINLKKINIIEDIEQKELEEDTDYTMIVYFVKAGDTIWSIAKRFKLSMDSIIQINNLENPERISIGDKLYIVK